MRVGLDVSLVSGQRSGGGHYSYELARELGRLAPGDRFLLYPVFYHLFHAEWRTVELPEAANVHVAFRRLPRPLFERLWRRNGFPLGREWLLGRVDVVHSTTYCAPAFRDRRKRLVVTVYDVSFLTHPECHTPENVAHCLSGTRAAISRADALVAISESTRRDLVERMGAPPGKIVVTPLAPSTEFARVTERARLEALRARYDLPPDFVLFLGAREPRKNLVRLMQAYATLRESLRDHVPLVIAGSSGWLNEDLAGRAGELGIARHVRFRGYLAAEDLPAVYSLATVFVYPSLYEGFGLPVVEAMACGAAVLTSDVSSLPEVVGDAGLLVDPLDVEALAEGLSRLLEDAELRSALGRRASARAATFSWERTARETLELYRALA